MGAIGAEAVGEAHPTAGVGLEGASPSRVGAAHWKLRISSPAGLKSVRWRLRYRTTSPCPRLGRRGSLSSTENRLGAIDAVVPVSFECSAPSCRVEQRRIHHGRRRACGLSTRRSVRRRSRFRRSTVPSRGAAHDHWTSRADVSSMPSPLPASPSKDRGFIGPCPPRGPPLRRGRSVGGAHPTFG